MGHYEQNDTNILVIGCVVTKILFSWTIFNHKREIAFERGNKFIEPFLKIVWAIKNKITPISY
jgi:hypothetical protein